MGASLSDLSIILTRPAGQNGSLEKKLNTLGAQTISFPCIEIQPVAHNDVMTSLPAIDIIIFVSPNAVKHGIRAIPELLKQSGPELTIAAVGHATAQALHAEGISQVTTPDKHFDSEGLLETALLKDAKGKSILIVKGTGGRPLLEDTLKQRGGTVHCIDVYRRSLPEHPGGEVIPAAVDLILFSSSESAVNFTHLVPHGHLPALLNCQTIAGHSKIGQKVSALGFKKLPIIAASPMEDDLLTAVTEWASQR
jgi:uroporphyrinogen-III synthase